MLAERLPGLTPPLDEAAVIEVASIRSVAGVLPQEPRGGECRPGRKLPGYVP